MHYVLVDNLLAAFRPGKLTDVAEAVRLDDALVERVPSPGSFIVHVTSIVPDCGILRLVFDSADECETWFQALLLASEFWVDNRDRRSRMALSPGSFGEPPSVS
jgi:hypothetical protein